MSSSDAHYQPIKRKVRYEKAPYPEDVACLFQPLTESQQTYLWHFGLVMFALEWAEILLYALVLAPAFGIVRATWIFGPVFTMTIIQYNFCMHDACHSAPAPPHALYKYTFCMLHDVCTMTWEDWRLEHTMHHKNTQDSLTFGEFGWDPKEPLWRLQSSWWTIPILPFVHMAGLHDFGLLDCLRWYASNPGYNWWGRIKRHVVQLLAWIMVWLLGCIPMGLPLAQGWNFALAIYAWARFANTVTFFVFHHWVHSEWWSCSSLLEPQPVVDFIMGFILFGKGRWMAIKYHDVHHAYYTKMGDPACRSRFFGADRVEKACLKIIHEGIYQDD